MTSTKADVETVDDRDPRVEYFGSDAWRLGGVRTEFNGTTHGTSVEGSQAQFTFNGMFTPLNSCSPRI